MRILKLIGEGIYYDLQVYRGEQNLEMVATFFEGSLRAHYNPHLVWLMCDPLVRNGEILEFRLEDLVLVEEQHAVTRPDGITVEMVKVWVKKGSYAMRMQPILVE